MPRFDWTYDFRDCKSLPADQKHLVEDGSLLKDWLDSGLAIEDFLHNKRGTIKGKEFGF
jgi:hypothetical protein